MKSIKTIRSLMLLAMLAAGVTACSKEEVTATGGDAPHGRPLNITVADDGYTAANPRTRAAENGYTTTFTAGDQIGLYCVKPDGTYAAENACLTLADGGDGTLTWQATAGTNLWYEGATTKYFAYYPYQATPNGTPRPAATAAPDFFADVVARWTPAADQSTPARYTAQDLMTGRGQLGSKQPDGTFTLTFSMTHAMALVVIETPATKYTFDNTPAIPEYNIPAPDTRFNGFTPYSPSVGTYRYLVKPATGGAADLYGSYTAASGNTKEYAVSPNIAAANYVCYKVDGGITSKTHTLAVGDFYFSDGTLEGKDASLTPAQQAACLGIVYWVGDITADDPLLKADHPACTHALVVAVQDATANEMQWSVNYEQLNNWTNAPERGGDKVNIIEKNKMQGYANTKALTAYNAQQSDDRYDVLPIAAIARYATAHPAPTNSSGWYFPSILELKYVCWGQGNTPSTSGKDLLNAQLGKLSGALPFGLNYNYWSSSEDPGYDYAWRVNFRFGSGNSDIKGSNCYVRGIFAF